jgi:hypothetical protein
VVGRDRIVDSASLAIFSLYFVRAELTLSAFGERFCSRQSLTSSTLPRDDLPFDAASFPVYFYIAPCSDGI